jgi:hypothetical protein
MESRSPSGIIPCCPLRYVTLRYVTLRYTRITSRHERIGIEIESHVRWTVAILQ